MKKENSKTNKPSVSGTTKNNPGIKKHKTRAKLPAEAELQRLYNELKESEDNFRSIFENNSSAIAIIEPDTTISMVNDACCKLIGFSKNELVGTSWKNQVHPKDIERLLEYNHSRLINPMNAPTHYEFSFVRKDKEIRHAIMSISFLQSSKKTITSFVDITEHMRAEELLKKSEERYRLFINATEDMAFLKDDQFRYLIVNPANAAYFGREESQIIGKTDFELMPEVMANQCHISDKLALSSDIINIQEEKVGNEVYETHKFKVPFSGNKLGVGGYIRNITERRRSEQLQKVLYTISNAVNSTYDIKELISLVREQLGTLLDTSNFYIAFYDEATGMLSTPYEVDEKDSIDSWLAEKSATGYVIKHQKSLLATEEEFQELCAKGEIEDVGSPSKIWLGVPLKVEGKIIGAIVVQSYHDADAYNLKDVEMLEFASHQVSNSIQRKWAEEDLKAALARAEESDRLKTAFLANLSHEIRTPMNAILGFSNLLNIEHYSQAEKSNFISIIQKSGKQLLCIISDIIEISKIVNNQVSINKNKFNLNSLLDSLLASFEIQRSNLGKLEIKLILEKSFKDEYAYLDTDEVKLAQIFNNLLYNALKFTEKGFIKFGCYPEDGKLIFYVEDTGIGIADDKQEIIFLRFRQENESQAAIFGGSGLGLSISKGLIELLGGNIWLKSTKGKGSTFFFSLPESVFVNQAIIADNQTVPLNEFDFSGKTILIADDNSDNVELMRNLLIDTNSSLIIANNGKEAVEVCQGNNHVDLVLMDIRMPVMDGYTATTNIRKFNTVIPIIALSALAFTEDFARFNDVGCTNFITKPIDINILLPLLKKYLF
jgi:PAS domain S-box-containing protein